MKTLLTIILLLPMFANAQTRNIVPRTDDAGNIGLSTLTWHGVYGTEFYGGGSNLTGVATSAQLTSTASALTTEIADRQTADGLRVLKSGGTMTGPLTVPNAVVSGTMTAAGIYNSGTSTATYFYGNGSTLTGVITSSVPYLPLAGGTMSGQLTLLGSSLTVNGAVQASTSEIDGRKFVFGSDGRYGVNMPAAGKVKFILHSGASGAEQGWYWSKWDGNSTYTDRMYLSHDGKLGVGTVIPVEYIEMGVTGGSILSFGGDRVFGTSTFASLSKPSLGTYISENASVKNYYGLGQVVGGYAFIANDSNPAYGNIGFYTGSLNSSGGSVAERLRITSTGKISMTGPLTISGSSLTVTGALGASVVYGVSVGSITTAAGSYINVNSQNQFVNPTTFTSSVTVTGASGEFGVKISSNLYVVGYSSAAKYYGDGSNLTAITPANISAGALNAVTSLTASSATINGDLGITKTYTESLSSVTVNSANWDISFASSTAYWLALSSSTTLTFSSVRALSNETFFIYQSSNTKTITWPTSPNIKWPAGTAPTLSTTTAKMDMINIYCVTTAQCYGVAGPAGY